MKKLLLAALMGGALAASPALAQSGGSGGLAGGSPGSPGDGGRAGTSTPYMGSSANRGVDPGMREGAPSPDRDVSKQRTTSRRNSGAATSSDNVGRTTRKRSGG